MGGFMITKTTLRKAIKILETEKKYVHKTFYDEKTNCYCALGAVAKVAGYFISRHGGPPQPAGFRALSELRWRAADVSFLLTFKLGVLADAHVRISRARAIGILEACIPLVPGKK